jgi:tetratricopeptide (TPR) repeat protein
MPGQPDRAARKPVTVIHFPKAGKPVPVPRRTMTLPEVSAFSGEDPVTEPESRALLDEQRAQPAKKASKRRKTAEIPTVPLVRADLALTPQESSDLAAMGHQLFELGRIGEARAVFERLIAGRADDAYAHTMLGTIFLALGDQDRALALFQAALEIDPNDIAARVYRGEVRLGKGKVRPALEDFERAMELGPADDPFVDRAARLLKMARAAFRKIKR